LGLLERNLTAPGLLDRLETLDGKEDLARVFFGTTDRATYEEGGATFDSMELGGFEPPTSWVLWRFGHYWQIVPIWAVRDSNYLPKKSISVGLDRDAAQ
jgi:hypothetical protein